VCNSYVEDSCTRTEFFSGSVNLTVYWIPDRALLSLYRKCGHCNTKWL